MYTITNAGKRIGNEEARTWETRSAMRTDDKDPSPYGSHWAP